ncbi:MAG TPA: LuxR C-terminal-related transcriptional regulator [Candidatus Limnocylindria bacterium]
MNTAAKLPELPDVWASVGTSDLPEGLVAAYREGDWKRLRTELSRVMDGAITDGRYGRELLQLVLGIPIGVNALFERYRTAALLDHGDWDALRTNLAERSPEASDIAGKREILTAPLDRSSLPPSESTTLRLSFELAEYQARNDSNLLRRWIQRVSGFYPEAFWAREDIAIGRHLRYRQLHDVALLAIAEARAGRLAVAHGLADEAEHLGDDGEPMRAVARDIVQLARRAMGDRNEVELTTPARIAAPTGPSPFGAGEMVLFGLPLLALAGEEALSWCARLLGYISSRLAAPRWQLQADSWRVAANLLGERLGNATDLAGLTARARRATPGLKALPTFLAGYAEHKYESFEEAERLARRSGNVWLQVSALTWMSGLDPRSGTVRQLRRLIEITGWRRPILVPSEVAADAALGMTSLGERSEAILEFALTADRPNVTTELVRRYVDDAATPSQARLAAVDTLGRVGTTHAREILTRLAQRRDEIGQAAARVADRPGHGLSEREIEVLTLAGQGLTNRQIGEKLFLSPHTIARHLQNARSKMGAANRAEAAVLLKRAE